MWAHPATQRNVALLAEYASVSVSLIGPEHGEVASGDVGEGRMAEPEQIVEAIAERLTPLDLADRHIVVTAGPTREDIDPVRFLSNRSSGKMGFAIAARAASRGARVTLVSGPVDLETPRGVDRIDVKSALQMQKEMMSALGPQLDQADALIMAAAVADFRVASKAEAKIERGQGNMTLELTPNPDLLATVGTRRASKKPVLVGFALETLDGTQLIARARQKLIKKQVDLVVANRSGALESAESAAFLVSATDCVDMGRLEKPVLAHQILNFVAEKFKQVESNEATE
jgi:phosphopantothenoylcysteine decarboxylase/phosphopantothenate--cysteine ligase